MGIFGVTGVTIQLERKTDGGLKEYRDSNHHPVSIVKVDDPEVNGVTLSGYTKYTHTLEDSFVHRYYISGFTHRGVTQTGFRENLSSHHSVSVYFSSNDSNNATPLVVDIGGSIYSMDRGKGNTWAPWYSTPSPVKIFKNLDRSHKMWSKNVVLRIDRKVNYDSVSVAVINSSDLLGYHAYKHTYTGNGGKFRLSRFNKGGITQNFVSLVTPVNGATEVIVFFSNETPNEPLLVYYKTETGEENGGPKTTTQRWFRKDDAPNTWTPNLYTTTPPTEPTDYDKILAVLKTLNC